MTIPQLTDFSESAIDAAFAGVRQEAEAAAGSGIDAEQFRLEWLGRKQGHLKAISDAWLKAAPTDAKKLIGQRFNQLKAEIEKLNVIGILGEELVAKPYGVAGLDVTLPGASRPSRCRASAREDHG